MAAAQPGSAPTPNQPTNNQIRPASSQHSALRMPATLGKEPMPLSPPLTPLPANLRFPHLGPQIHGLNPYHHILLAAQYQQQMALPRPQLPTGQSQEIMEQLQRLIQLRNGLGGPVVDGLIGHNNSAFLPNVSLPTSTPSLASTEASNLVVNNNNITKTEDEIKREEAMVDDEMKEDDIEEELDDNEDKAESKEQPPNLIKTLQMNLWLKKMCEDLKKNSKQEDAKEMMLDQDEDESLMSESNDHEVFTTSSSNGNVSQNGGPNASLNNSSGDERKVRVRTLISDEQLSVLKSYYNKNPRPKREELERISAQIGHPFKVVKVWFQNSRARDRREGKPVVNSNNSSNHFFNEMASSMASAASMAASATGLFPRLPLLGPILNQQQHPSMKASMSPRSCKSPFSTTSDEVASVVNNKGQCDQPLDLSNKGSSPSVSPLSETKEVEDTLNLSVLEHFRRAAASAVASASGVMPPSTVDGGATSASMASIVTGVASNLVSTTRPLDIYRFQEDLETSGSAGSGGATTDEEGRFTCEKCDKTFTKQSSLSRHKYEHSGNCGRVLIFLE